MRDEITFTDLARQVKFLARLIIKKFIIIVLAGLAGGIAGALIAYLSTPKYQAEVVFVAEDNGREAAGGLAGLASQFGINLNMSNDAFSARNMVGLLSSNKMIISTLLAVVEINGKKDRLLNFYLENTGMAKAFKKNEKLKGLSFPVNQKKEDFSRLQDSILLITVKNIKNGVIDIEKIEDNNDFFKITCISNNEDFSLLFSKQVLNELVTLYIQTKTQRAQKIVDLIEKRADSIKTEYNKALSSRASAVDENMNPALQLPLVNVQRRQTDITVLGTEYGEIIKNLELARFNLMKETPLVQVIDDPQLPLKRLKPSFIVYGILGSFMLATIVIIYLVSKQKKISQPVA